MHITKSALLAAVAAFALASPVWAAFERQSPQLSATVDGVVGAESQELSIESLDVDVRRHGSVATTEITVKFANPSNQTLEGQFALTMPKGSVVTGYALDVNGAMIEGVLQPRDRAREAFDKRVVRRIDPGLAEVDFSDRFETRVYPILPNQGRTIRIRFVSPLDGDQRYVLPLETGDIGEYTIRLKGIAPVNGRGIRWREEGDSFIAGGTGKLDGEISFAAPTVDGLTLSEHPGEGTFFELTGTVQRTATEEEQSTLTIAWDRSVSRLDDQVEKEARLAAKIAQEMGVASVRLLLFDSGKSEILSVAARELQDTLRNVRYAGGTSYTGLAVTLGSEGGTCILFSDGRATIDNRENLSAAGCRLIAIGSGTESDRTWLDGQARMLGGRFIDIAGMDDREVVRLALSPAPLPAVTDSAKNAVEVRVLPADVGRYRLVGPMPQNGRLFVDGMAVQSATPLTPNFAGPGALWAAQHIAMVRDSMGSEELAAEARRWSVAVPGVSFIVLETPEDYFEAGFVPPDNYPKMMRERFNQLRQERDAENREIDQHFRDELINAWEQRKDWWAQTKRQKPNQDRTNDQQLPDETRPDLLPVSRPSPIAPPPPPPMPMPRIEPAETESDGRNEGDRIIVTANRRERDAEDVVVPASATNDEGLEERSDSADDAFVELSDSAATAVNEQELLKLGQTIETAEWSVDRPYIARWIAAGDAWPTAVAKTEKEHGSIPLFYLDLAEWHFRSGRAEEAQRAAEAALDLPSKDNQTLAIVAQRLLRYGASDRAIWLLTKLADTEAERPQPLMALAQAYAVRGRRSGNREDIVEAQNLMIRVAMKKWDRAYGQVSEIALAEANALIVELGGPTAAGVELDSQFIAPMPVDVRVVAEWNTPRTDLDLWVREPSGEEVGYSHTESRAGARYTDDLTQGYGPEEYQIRKASDGTYWVEINTFAVDRRNPNGPSVVTVRLIRNFATGSQVEETIDVEMQPDAQGRKLIGRIEIE